MSGLPNWHVIRDAFRDHYPNLGYVTLVSFNPQLRGSGREATLTRFDLTDESVTWWLDIEAPDGHDTRAEEAYDTLSIPTGQLNPDEAREAARAGQDYRAHYPGSPTAALADEDDEGPPQDENPFQGAGGDGADSEPPDDVDSEPAADTDDSPAADASPEAETARADMEFDFRDALEAFRRWLLTSLEENTPEAQVARYRIHLRRYKGSGAPLKSLSITHRSSVLPPEDFDPQDEAMAEILARSAHAAEVRSAQLSSEALAAQEARARLLAGMDAADIAGAQTQVVKRKKKTKRGKERLEVRSFQDIVEEHMSERGNGGPGRLGPGMPILGMGMGGIPGASPPEGGEAGAVGPISPEMQAYLTQEQLLASQALLNDMVMIFAGDMLAINQQLAGLLNNTYSDNSRTQTRFLNATAKALEASKEENLDLIDTIKTQQFNEMTAMLDSQKSSEKATLARDLGVALVDKLPTVLQAIMARRQMAARRVQAAVAPAQQVGPPAAAQAHAAQAQARAAQTAGAPQAPPEEPVDIVAWLRENPHLVGALQRSSVRGALEDPEQVDLLVALAEDDEDEAPVDPAPTEEEELHGAMTDMLHTMTRQAGAMVAAADDDDDDDDDEDLVDSGDPEAPEDPENDNPMDVPEPEEISEPEETSEPAAPSDEMNETQDPTADDAADEEE